MKDFVKEWKVEAQGVIFEAKFEELRQWIAEGAVLPSDRVKRGDLRWLAAEKVPELWEFFNSFNENGAISADNSKSEYEEFQTQFAFENSTEENEAPQEDETICFIHTDSEVVYACDVCKHFFCKACPKSFGGSVKLCPLCDALCRSVSEPVNINKSVGAVNKPYSKTAANEKNPANQDELQDSGFTKMLETALPTVFSSLSKLRRS
ncbi:MAG: hypothetical protein WA584_00245 [Pyrinomonadaceae bacterium]